MARSRNIKPGFFKNEDLAECTPWARLCFAGLWCLADREGRLEDRPKRIKGELFPYDTVDVEPLLQELERFNFIHRYEIDGFKAIQILEFAKHQSPHYTEGKSTIKPHKLPESFINDETNTPDNSGSSDAIKRGPKPPDSLIPDSLIHERTTSSGKPDPAAPESSDLVQAKEALEYLNAKTRSAFRPVPANLDLIRARLREGYSLEAVKSVVDAKTLEWIDDAKMQKFLRPATLFGRTNFSQYAGVVESTPARDWWLSAGFSNPWEAENAGCTEGNRWMWENRQQVRTEQDWPAWKARQLDAGRAAA
ncbi:conserved phage C-terminal domain-containing protein [Achromobacter xylosoxidans]|jgi:uncharacterized phage protein (TIGR02220 family)|uniref:conserved phage C-terminal domain-containing protein n=1 Tax=Alcaligenes xylosoxydans xylosoxydans TaxID=85698 RepID=UPI0006C2F1D3|nr:conserved phage C-terminal domain-containing protein [Achromobacter xylosoxidans]CUJ51602.1 Conserved phage C-terminus (Phg_2220_C) [Achromobacter xylosoxidans]